MFLTDKLIPCMNPSASIPSPIIDYPISDTSLPFTDYIIRCRDIIEKRRFSSESAEILQHINPEFIINANSPFELYPNNPNSSGKRLKYGALLIHGLLDCPFSLRDIGLHLQHHDILSRAILLPGHGSKPCDLLKVSYHDWIQAVRYGVETLRQEVDHIFLIGYSTGAALSIYHALQDSHIAGIVLLSPAIRIKAPVDIVVGWHYLIKWLTRNNLAWLYNEDETDYAKYKSIAFNSVNQVSQLTKVIQELRQHHSLTTPMFMVVSREDETISSHRAIHFFSTITNQDNKLLIYSSVDHKYPDSRIFTRSSRYPELHIKHFSHASIPFAPNNPHYGQKGDLVSASYLNSNQSIFGAYNRIEEKFYGLLYKLRMAQQKRHELTYNPDFNFLAEKITQFILGK